MSNYPYPGMYGPGYQQPPPPSAVGPSRPLFYPPGLVWQGYNPNMSIVDLLPPEMHSMVPEHWNRFPPMNPLWYSILGVVMIILGIVSITGNGLVMYLMTTVKSLRNPTNFLVANLAFSDFMMMSFNMTTMAINSFAQTWVLGPFMCELYGMWGSLFGCGSIWSLVFITRDRYNVIVRGMAAAPLTHKRAVLQVLFIWIYSFAWTFLPFLGWSRYVPEGNMTSCTVDYLSKDFKTASYLVVYAIFVYFIPLITLVYHYSYIVGAVATHEKTLREQAKKMNVASLRANVDANKQSAEIRIAKVAMYTVFLWFMAWTPYLILSMLGIFTSGDLLTPMVSIWGAVFAKSAACYNPIVYALSHPKYRRALFKKFPSLACVGEPSEEYGADAKSEMSVTTGISDASESVRTSEA
ncbi:lateral eye opsin-like [Brevipalpus obovatus]|uniref:lateral eye opsin-like n=1 Tax=Brevipalpus obovatus TaxID=246614 RepID=UPI003D9E70E1